MNFKIGKDYGIHRYSPSKLIIEEHNNNWKFKIGESEKQISVNHNQYSISEYIAEFNRLAKKIGISLSFSGKVMTLKYDPPLDDYHLYQECIIDSKESCFFSWSINGNKNHICF